MLSGAAIQLNWGWIAFSPVLLLMMAGLGLGFGVIISSLTTKYRDLRFLVTFGVTLWMYATPVIYPIQRDAGAGAAAAEAEPDDVDRGDVQVCVPGERECGAAGAAV